MLIFRLRKLMNTAILFGSQMTTLDSFNTIVDSISFCLDADKASVWLFDDKNEVLWTKKTADDKEKILTCPSNKGIVGDIFTKGQ